MDLKIPARVASYFGDLLAVRAMSQRSGLPFWNIVSSNQIRPTTTIPSPANLRLQAYTTLGGGRARRQLVYLLRRRLRLRADRHGRRKDPNLEHAA